MVDQSKDVSHDWGELEAFTGAVEVVVEQERCPPYGVRRRGAGVAAGDGAGDQLGGEPVPHFLS